MVQCPVREGVQRAVCLEKDVQGHVRVAALVREGIWHCGMGQGEEVL